MAAAQNPTPPPKDWHQEGSSHWEWSPKGQLQSSDIILPTVALHPLPLLHGPPASSLGNVPQVRNLATIIMNEASTPASTVLPNNVRGNVDLAASGSDRGAGLSGPHVEPQLGLEDPSSPNQPEVEKPQSFSLSVDTAQGVRVGEHGQNAAQHAITSREVHNESPTNELWTGRNDESSTMPSATPTESGLGTQNATIFNDYSTANDTATRGFQVVQGNATEGLGNVTAVGGLESNSSVGEADFPGNSSELSSKASGSFLNRQVPATTQDPWAANTSSGHAVEPPSSHMPICLSRMDIVWIVLAISVPVSSCCKSESKTVPSAVRLQAHPRLPLPLSTSSSRAFDGVLHEAQEEVIEPGEQPELLEQRHHHGLFQQARRGAAQTDTHPGERGLVDISSSVVANISLYYPGKHSCI